MLNTTSNPFGLMATPALDLAPSGHLPYIVDQAHPDADTDGAHESAPCHMYPGLCVLVDGEDGDAVGEDGRHFDHGSHALTVPSGEMPEDDPAIWAAFVHVSGRVPKIGFMGEDLTPAETRARASELRRMADDMDALADQVDIARGLFNIRKARETADPAFAEVFTIMEDAIVKDGADPADVSNQVLELLQQARAERATGTRR